MEVKFPFEPNEKVKAAFRQQGTLAEMTKIITEALVSVSANLAVNPWQVLYKEHPEIIDASKSLSYNHLHETIDLKCD